jgi:hypothetical protein
MKPTRKDSPGAQADLATHQAVRQPWEWLSKPTVIENRLWLELYQITFKVDHVADFRAILPGVFK